MRAVVIVLLVLLGPRALAAQTFGGSDPRPEDRKRFSLAAGAGLSIFGHDGQSVSFGFSPVDGLTLVLTAERHHIPAERRIYPDGYSLTRGGTWQAVLGELRFSLPSHRKIRPYVMAGLGRGIGHPTVNDDFPDAVRNTVRMGYAGGGISVGLNRHLSAFADMRAGLVVERDSVMPWLPIRGGITWHF